MTLIILSDENLRAGKAALHAALPEVRSCHLAEAIAAGAGRRQFASLIAEVRGGAGNRPAVAGVSDAAFVRRLAELGYCQAHAGHLEAAFSDAVVPHPAYVFHQRGDREANDRHYRLCDRLGRPMVMVRMARRYAELEWDCITVDPREEDYLHDRSGSELVGIMFNLFQARAKGAPGKPVFFGSAFTGTVKNLLPTTARQLAEDYSRLLYSPLLETRGPKRRSGTLQAQ